MNSQIARSRKPRILPKVGWSVMLILAVFMFLLASRYLTLNPKVYFPEQRAVYLAQTPFLLTHIIGAMLATIIGPFQFIARMRTGRLLRFHRWLGRTYLLGVLSGGLGGLYMAQLAYGGLFTRLGFSVLGILWLFSGFMAYKHILNKDSEKHREWMKRNYALTFAAVMLRLWQLVFSATGVDFLVSYNTVAWLCWIPNLIIAEWMVRKSRTSQRRLQVNPAR
jgi:hypothetical protein